MPYSLYSPDVAFRECDRLTPQKFNFDVGQMSRKIKPRIDRGLNHYSSGTCVTRVTWPVSLE